MCFGRGIGADVVVDTPHRAGYLFGEAQSRIVVEVSDERIGDLRAAAQEAGVPMEVLGRTGGTTLHVHDLIEVDVEDLRSTYERALPNIMTSEVES